MFPARFRRDQISRLFCCCCRLLRSIKGGGGGGLLRRRHYLKGFHSKVPFSYCSSITVVSELYYVTILWRHPKKELFFVEKVLLFSLFNYKTLNKPLLSDECLETPTKRRRRLIVVVVVKVFLF